MTTRFRYRAATSAGQLVDGVADVPSRERLIEQLRTRQLHPVRVEEAPERRAATRTHRLGRGAAVAVWARNFATLLGAGVPVERALAITATQAGRPDLGEALHRIRRSVEEGATLADGMAQHPALFSPVVSGMVAAGEASGALEPVFERLADHLEEMTELRSQVRAALIYPALMGVVASVGTGVLLLFVVPRFTSILEEVGGSLPWSTQVIVGVSELLTGFWWLWMPLLLVGGYALWVSLRAPEMRRRWHAARLGWPWIGDVELKFQTASFTRTLAMLLEAGVPVVPALQIARAAVANVSLGERIGEAVTTVSEGGAVASALSGTVPPMAVHMLAVGEESGRLGELCGRVADTCHGEVRRALRTAVSMIEPVMILVFGALVGFVALAMLQAIYSINTSGF